MGVTDRNPMDRIYGSVLLVVYCAIAFFMVRIHEPWMDELHSWVMARDLSFGELLAAMREEGHFCLWYLLLAPFARSGCDVLCLRIISVSLTAIAAYLFIFKTKFSLLAKAAVLLSFPMIYSFPAVSRCYALIPPLLFGIALTYKDLPGNRYYFAILVGLLANTHVYMEGMVLALFLVYLYEVLLPKYRRGELRMEDFGPPVFIVAFVSLAFLQVMRNPFSDVFVTIGNTRIVRDNVCGLEPTVGVFFKYHSIIPAGIVPAGLKAIIVYTLAFIPMSILAWKMFLDFDKAGRFIVLVAVGWQFLFSLFIYSFGLHRVHLPFFIILTVFMMGGRPGKKENTMVVLLCIIVSISGYCHNIYNDIKRPYSNWEPLAKAIEDNVPEGEVVYSTIFFGENVSVYLSDPGRTIVSMPMDSIKSESFFAICWDSSSFNADEAEAEIVYESRDCISENYSLLRISKKEAITDTNACSSL